MFRYIKKLHDRILSLETSAPPHTNEPTDYDTLGSSADDNVKGPYETEIPQSSHIGRRFDAVRITPGFVLPPRERHTSISATNWFGGSPEEASAGSYRGVVEKSQPSRNPQPSYRGRRSSEIFSESDAAGSGDCINAMGVVYPVQSQTTNSDETYYGHSSVASLQNQIQAISEEISQPDHSVDLRHPGVITVQQGTPDRRARTSIRSCHLFSLPPRNIADQLLKQYWDGVYLFYPWIHRPSFLRYYESLWRSEDSTIEEPHLPRVGLGGRSCTSTVYHCALNAIFALACQFPPTIPDIDEKLAADFMEKAYGHLQVELLDKAGLALVQTLLMIATYLQSTENPMRCWGISGLAMRMAQGIGLHTNFADKEFSTLEIEMRRRAWHGCLFMDR